MVLDKLKRYFKSLSQWKDFFLRTKSNLRPNEICCLEIDSKSFSIAHARYENGKILLLSLATYPYTTLDDLDESLITVVKYYKLETMNCSWILQPEQYQLLLIDALPVPENEFQSAVRWKIKDLIRFPIDDIIVDSFPLPIKKAATGQDMLMAVVTKLSDLQLMSKRLEKTGLHLNRISILELSLRNIAVLFSEDAKTTALIYMDEKNSQLILTSKQDLHFARRIELGVALFDSSENNSPEEDLQKKIDRLALEIQRSFDYYQSQWRQAMPTRIIFSSVRPISFNITTLLSQRLSIPTEILDVTKYLHSTKVISVEEQGKYLPIIGGLFQHEGNHHVARN